MALHTRDLRDTRARHVAPGTTGHCQRVVRSALGVLVALVLASSPSLASSGDSAPASPDSLGTSTGTPWNPPHAMARRRAWEEVVLLPGRIVSLPLSGLGRVTDNLLFRMEQNPRYASGLRHIVTPGGLPIRLKTARMGDRTGLGGAAEIHQDILHGAFASTVSAEYAATLHKYDRVLVAWAGRPMSVQYGYEWRPADQFYGVGNRTPERDRSDYAGQGEFLRGGLAWESNRHGDPARPHFTFGLWGGPRTQVTRTGRESGETSYEARYSSPVAAMLDERVENMVYGTSMVLDRLTGAPHWSEGWRARLSAERFDAPIHALALHSSSGPGAQFTRYQASIETGLSFMRDPRSVRLMVRAARQDAGPSRDRMLVSDLSTLGGQAGLGGYSPGRFHDFDLLFTRLQYVFPLQRHFEVELHSEWGAVYPDLWQDASLGTLHNSLGLSLRARDEHAARASVGLDFSREAVRIRYSIGGLE